MIEIGTMECINMALAWVRLSTGEDRDWISVLELNQWRDFFHELNPMVHLDTYRDSIGPEHGYGNIHWEIRDSGPDILYVQEKFKCPICGERLLKYPDVENFEKMKKIAEQVEV